MSGIYDEEGISFQYPENWQLGQTQDDETSVQVTVSSPNTAFWSLSVYPGERDVRLLLQEVLQAMQAEYPELEYEQADQWIDKQPLVGYDIQFLCFDLTSTALVRVFTHRGATCLVLAQAEDRELEVAEPVFQAMIVSLLAD